MIAALILLTEFQKQDRQEYPQITRITQIERLIRLDQQVPKLQVAAILSPAGCG